MSYRSWGYPARIHALKVGPWTARLKAANDELAAAYQEGDMDRIHAALVDAAWWEGRLVADVIPAVGHAGLLSRRELCAAMRQVLRSHRLRR